MSVLRTQPICNHEDMYILWFLAEGGCARDDVQDKFNESRLKSASKTIYQLYNRCT